MDLRRQLFPSPAVTNTVTTCQSSTIISNHFSQPVNTSVHATPSIRSIRPNIVKSRAQVFEKQDTDMAKNLQPSTVVIVTKTNASSPSSVSTCVASGHSIVKPSKSADHLEHIDVSSVPFIRAREKVTKISFDNEQSAECHKMPLPPRNYLRQMQSVGVDRDEMPEKPSDLTVRLQQFESRPAVLDKPAISPKPRSQCPHSSANFVGVCRSKSSDSLKQSEVDSGVKASFCFSPGDRMSQFDDRSSHLYSQDSALKITNKSFDSTYLHDAAVKQKGSYRQVREVVVIDPLAQQHVNETVVANPLPSSGPDIGKVIAPKPPPKPQVKETVVFNTSPSTRPISPPFSHSEMGRIASPKPPKKPQVKETVDCSLSESSRPVTVFPSLSSSETSKVVLPKPPEKPPRMTVVRPSPVTPNDSYGLLVYAAGQDRVTPSVRLEKLGSTVNDPSAQEISGRIVADMHSHLESQGEGNPSVPEAVLSSSRLQDREAVRFDITAQSPFAADAWDKKFIRAPKHTPVVRSRGEKENFVSKRRMNNPNYMYVSVYTDDIIPSQQKTVKDKQPLTRHHSADVLNTVLASLHPHPKSPCYKEPLYAVPYEVTSDTYQIMFDTAGYAKPYLPNTPQFKVISYSCVYSCS